jgi:hypothetical protein
LDRLLAALYVKYPLLILFYQLSLDYYVSNLNNFSGPISKKMLFETAIKFQIMGLFQPTSNRRAIQHSRTLQISHSLLFVVFIPYLFTRESHLL